ncbi:hypothetical protein Hanom_Chr04g00293561 [Helianthus anomalus]
MEKVDPTHIKERVEFGTKKTVEIIYPKPKKVEGGVKKDRGFGEAMLPRFEPFYSHSQLQRLGTLFKYIYLI